MGCLAFCVCSAHQTPTLGCVHALALFETMGCLSSALGAQTDRQEDCKGHVANQNGHQNLRFKRDFLYNQEQQSLVPLFIDAS